ncbi:MAG: glycosyltransferase [Alphaproteobacteria bacterium]|nr:glycosyltransferase [Alphaproteobacteria bacterium]
MANILIYKKNHLIESSGGAERIIVEYSNTFARRGHNVSLVTRDNVNGFPFYPLDKKVLFKHFDFKFSKLRRFIGNRLRFLGLIKYFPSFNRELLVSDMLLEFCNEFKPDVVIVAGMQELIDFSAYGERNFPIILMLHSHPNAYFTKKRNALYKKYINNASAVQVLMKSYEAYIPENYKGKIVTIGNPVPSVVNNEERENTIIYLARIDRGKAHHLLIEAFNKISSKHPEWNVLFYGAVGDKKQYQYCLDLIEKYKLQDNVIFKGTTNEPHKALLKSKICAFPSQYEGFSLAQTEAMACGLPVIGFDYCSGVNELIKNNKNGYLVKDVDEFAEKLDLLMSNENLRSSMGIEACKISDEYSIDKIINTWEELINNVRSEK